MIRSRASERVRVAIVCGGGRTKQSMRDECDINRIMRKYIKTGTVAHVNKYAGRYEYVTSADFMESLAIVEEGKRMFDELPAVVRKRFENNPAQFLAFVQDRGNLEEMRALGLAKRADPPAASGAPSAPSSGPPSGGPPSTPPT